MLVGAFDRENTTGYISSAKPAPRIRMVLQASSVRCSSRRSNSSGRILSYTCTDYPRRIAPDSRFIPDRFWLSLFAVLSGREHTAYQARTQSGVKNQRLRKTFGGSQNAIRLNLGHPVPKRIQTA